MAKLNKGKLLLRCAAHALFVGLKEIPGMGMAVEIGHGWFDIFHDEQRKAGFGERLEQLEQAATILPGEARTIADDFIAEQRAKGITVVEEQAEAIRDLLMFMPATIKERTQATLQLARQHGTDIQTILPITDETSLFEQEEFYRSLFPARRPRFQTNDSIPHGLAGWRLGELLGTGGFGEVWEVRHERLRYAIKFFLGEINERILTNEAKMLFDVHEKLPRHANIVHLNQLNLEKSPYWLLFEFVEGGTLESLLRAAPLSWQESLSLFRQIVAGVAAVHQIGIVHRDLKPANILLTADGIPKITDFGIGKVLAENELQMTRTQYTMQGFGSLGYMSKEQRKGKKAHPADDTYALGVLLWQMLVQTLDAPDLDWLEELQQLDDIPETLQNVVFACLNKSRQQRPQDAGKLLEMLRPDRFPKPVRSEVEDELLTLNRQLADLQDQEAEAIENNEAVQQRELARQKLLKEQEVARKQRQVEAESARQKVYAKSMQHAKVEQAEINVQAEERLAELRKLVKQKRQRNDAPLQLQEAMEELRQVEALIGKIESDYSKEKEVQQQKIEQGLQKALGELGEFQATPRSRFEKTQEHEQRKVRHITQQEKIKTSWQQEREKLDKRLNEACSQDLAVLKKQRDILLNKQFDVPPTKLQLELLDYNADEELMQFKLIAEEVVPDEHYIIENSTLPIVPKEAKTCWLDWEQELLIPYLVLGLNKEVKPKVIKAGFETAMEQYYSSDLELLIDKYSKFETVTVDIKGKIINRKQHKTIQIVEDINGVSLEMVYIPSGEFMMGSDKEKTEKPIHKVTIKQPFYMSKYPIIQAQWQAVMGNNPSNFKGENRPVENISWKDAIEFCEKLSKLTNQIYRLPSEAEWEYACRAGTTTPFYFGETITPELANYNGNYTYGSGSKGKYRKQTTEVGIFLPNNFGLYDMHGNVWEWCADGWYDNYKDVPTDGSVWEKDNENRVLRGGSWGSIPYFFRSAYRNRDSYPSYGIGFRLVGVAARTF
ncbi:SUMF1/EgtB/PvdO family nonheme iron enzyme [Candidatus Halobeggiatoa sp. HSG11]|nr:SUMF1/EgtB/PvdO family nonheme iron enzyme [Candidatus Halobeggiatoa sp. HSG11]